MRTIRLDTLLHCWALKDIVGPGWFLNADLQGAELMALRGMGDLLWKFDHAYIEVNEKHLYKDCPLTPEIDDHLAKFQLFPKETKMMKQGWGDRYYSRK